jgi:tetratricopeptide (TPR) repeat protein
MAAWRAAIAFYEQALANTDEQQRCDILMAMGQAYYAAGDAVQATTIYAQAAALAKSLQLFVPLRNRRGAAPCLTRSPKLRPGSPLPDPSTSPAYV